MGIHNKVVVVLRMLDPVRVRDTETWVLDLDSRIGDVENLDLVQAFAVDAQAYSFQQIDLAFL